MIVDTDIGDDPNDAAALAMLARWPDVEIMGVTTVNDDHGRRAGYARYLLNTAGRNAVPVFAGADVRGGYFRPKKPYVTETKYWPDDIHPLPGREEDAVAFLEEGVRRGALMIGIGPLTNFALLERRHLGILSHARLTVMGGWTRADLDCSKSDYNFQADITSTQIVLGNSRPILLTLNAAVRTALRLRDVGVLARGSAIERLIARQSLLFAEEKNLADVYGGVEGLPPDFVNFHHDELTIAVALGWPHCTRKHINLQLDESEGYLLEREHPCGTPVEAIVDVEAERFNDFWLHVMTTGQL